MPHGTVTFVKEDLDGSSPKFLVRDQDGQKWKVKLGIEARPETAASRIVWAVGYYANEDYFVRELQVLGMPDRLHRGERLIGPKRVRTQCPVEEREREEDRHLAMAA